MENYDYLSLKLKISSDDEKEKNLLDEVSKYLAKNPFSYEQIKELFFFASQKGHLQIIKYLKKFLNNLHENDDYAFRVSAERGYLLSVQYFIEQNVDIHSCDDYALRYSSMNGHESVVRYLISKNADIHSRLEFSLKKAIINGHLKIVKILIENKADYFIENGICLNLAVEKNRYFIVNFLIEKGLSTHGKDQELLDLCIINEDITMIRLLEKIGCNLKVIPPRILKEIMKKEKCFECRHYLWDNEKNDNRCEKEECVFDKLQFPSEYCSHYSNGICQAEKDNIHKCLYDDWRNCYKSKS